MQELPMVIVVFGALVFAIDHIRRLFAAISLNRTIREALRHHPESVAPLLNKLETRAPLPLALGGWVFLALGLFTAAMATLYGEADRENILAAVTVSVLGLALLVANWWLSRRAAPTVAATPPSALS